MARETAREKAEMRKERYAAEALRRSRRARKERCLIGRFSKETRRLVSLTVERISERVAPSENPWDDENWMAM